MNSQLHWRDAIRADRAKLQCNFVCTEPQPVTRRYGRAAPPVKAPWEVEVQGFLKNMQPPAPDGQMMLIGEDDDGIAAVGWTAQMEDPGHVFIKAMAVALRLRGCGRNVGDELINELVDRLTNRAEAAGRRELVIEAKVHPDNHVCKKLCTRAGGETFDDEDGYEVWVLPVVILDDDQ